MEIPQIQKVCRLSSVCSILFNERAHLSKYNDRMKRPRKKQKNDKKREK
jgi:hypothetical protein